MLHAPPLNRPFFEVVFLCCIFASSGFQFGPFWAKVICLAPKSAKKHSSIDPSINFIANFCMQAIFPRPWGGTSAAGNRDSPPGRLRPTRGVLGLDHNSACFLPALGFCNMLVFFLGGFHPGFPLSPLIGRILVTLRRNIR